MISAGADKLQLPEFEMTPENRHDGANKRPTLSRESKNAELRSAPAGLAIRIGRPMRGCEVESTIRKSWLSENRIWG